MDMDGPDSKKKPLPSRWECANCSLPDQPGVSLRPCSRCKLVRYCGTECQAQHWKKGGHKRHCVAPEQRKPQTAVIPGEDQRKPHAIEHGSAEWPTCVICMHIMTELSSTTKLPCSHVLHTLCLEGLRSSSSVLLCPTCRADLSHVTELPAKNGQLSIAEKIISEIV